MLPTITLDVLDLPPGTRLQFPATFEEYQQLAERLEEQSAIRIRFRDNQIFLMVPLPEHGNQTDMLSDLVKALLRHTHQDWQGFNVITLKKPGIPGVEPDACFYIQNRLAILGKHRIDLDQDPPPDLAIETDLTSITDYEPFAVPEVWIYRAGQLTIHHFQAGGYHQADDSAILPGFAIAATLPQYVQRAWTVGSSQALREFEQWLEGGRAEA